MLLPVLGSLLVVSSTSRAWGKPSVCQKGTDIYANHAADSHTAINGTDFNLSNFRGLTHQYVDMNNLLSKYEDMGLRVVGFPCNQFGLQEPGGNKEILPGLKYVRPGNNFEPHERMVLTEKLNVNGVDAHPLYKYLRENCPAPVSKMENRARLFYEELDANDIRWNFEKILVDKKGVARYRFADDDWENGNSVEPYLKKLLDENQITTFVKEPITTVTAEKTAFESSTNDAKSEKMTTQTAIPPSTVNIKFVKTTQDDENLKSTKQMDVTDF